jgi:hypothetical protein
MLHMDGNGVYQDLCPEAWRETGDCVLALSRAGDIEPKPSYEASRNGAMPVHYSYLRMSTGNSRAAARAGRMVAPIEMAIAARVIQTPSNTL